MTYPKSSFRLLTRTTLQKADKVTKKADTRSPRRLRRLGTIVLEQSRVTAKVNGAYAEGAKPENQILTLTEAGDAGEGHFDAGVRNKHPPQPLTQFPLADA